MRITSGACMKVYLHALYARQRINKYIVHFYPLLQVCMMSKLTITILMLHFYIVGTYCMKPYNIKDAAMPTYAILAQVKLNIGTGQSSCSMWTVTDGEIYLASPS